MANSVVSTRHCTRFYTPPSQTKITLLLINYTAVVEGTYECQMNLCSYTQHIRIVLVLHKTNLRCYSVAPKTFTMNRVFVASSWKRLASRPQTCRRLSFGEVVRNYSKVFQRLFAAVGTGHCDQPLKLFSNWTNTTTLKGFC